MSKLFDDSSLAMIPSAVKDGKLYSIRPTDGSGDFTFSRGSNLAATRVDVNGLIEKGRENLLLQSNQFDTTWTIVNNGSLTSGQVGYDGTNDAWLYTKTGNGSRLQQVISASGVQTYSIYAKANASDWVRFLITASTGNEARYFNLSNGTKGSSIYDGEIESTITSVGNNWYRITLTFSETTTGVRLYPANADGDTSATSGSIYIQDAQLEQGLVATDYIETGASTAQAGILEDLPRLDYSGGASCPSLLLEPQRSNLFTQSEYLQDWTDNDVTRTSNNSISPEGVQNATLIGGDGTFGVHRFYQTPTYISGTSYTISIFAKAGTNDFFQIYLGNAFDNSAGQVYANFDLSDGSKGTAGSNVDDYDIEDYGNGWYRCYLTAESQLSGTTGTFCNLTTSDSVGRAATSDISTNAEFYGAQCEAGSYPTSYIPTYGSAVTRSYDDCDLLDLVSKDIITDATQWTIMFEVDGFSTEYNSPDGQWFAGQDGTLDVYMRPNGTADIYAKFYWRKDGKYIGGSLGKKMIARLSDGIGTTFVDGVLDGSSSITGDYSGIGFNKTSNSSAAGYLKQILIFPTALTDSECIALTTL